MVPVAAEVLVEAQAEGVDREVPAAVRAEAPVDSAEDARLWVDGPLWEADPTWAAGDTDPHHPLDGAADAAAVCCRSSALRQFSLWDCLC